MADEINLGGAIYISSKRAAAMTGYAQDYIGQLARSGAVEAKRVSGLWYILESSILGHKEKSADFKPEPPEKSTEEDLEVSISFDGNDYISARRASEITGYSQDYVGQLARAGKILSRQIGNRWFVHRQELIDHKKEKDALLAAVQRDSVGLPEQDMARQSIQEPAETHFTYYPEAPGKTESPESQVLPIRDESEGAVIPRQEEEEVNQIPIRIVETSEDELYKAVKRPKRPFMAALVISVVGTGICLVGLGLWYLVPMGGVRSVIIGGTSNIPSQIIEMLSKTIEYKR